MNSVMELQPDLTGQDQKTRVSLFLNLRGFIFLKVFKCYLP